MLKPKTGKTYWFVRNVDGRPEATKFVRHEDGSSGFLVDSFFHIYEGHAAIWQQALNELARLRFVEFREAKDAGIVPADWQPEA